MGRADFVSIKWKEVPKHLLCCKNNKPGSVSS